MPALEAVRIAGDSGAPTETFAIEEFLAVEQAKDLLRFSTAGSVDDGKSTLIGRLLYDSRNVYEDQVRAVTGKVAALGKTGIDFAQLTDGLRAEREQGITIDVAYRYFSTQRRKFIIADTPGHEQYTRNMATGASTADLAIILVDARKGILTQSRRHAFIASLLGIRHLVAAVNKMDLVDFSEDMYRRIESDLRELVEASFNSANHDPSPRIGGDKSAIDGAGRLTVIPVSALEGDNVVEASANMPWYQGPTLLQHLEEVPVGTGEASQPFRLLVQRVIRPDQHYRGFAGQIAAGTIRKGDEIVALPSGRRSRVASITTFDGDLDTASAPLSIALTLEDELDISRGDLIATPATQPQSATAVQANLVWFDASRLESEKPYLLKHGSLTLNARVTRVLHRFNIQTLDEEAVHTLAMNDIGVAEITLTKPLFFDAYKQNRTTGSFILIDPATNATVAAGMIRSAVTSSASAEAKTAIIAAANDSRASEIETLLLEAGVAVITTKITSTAILQRLLGAGVTVIVNGSPDASLSDELLDTIDGNADDFQDRLREAGLFAAHNGGSDV